MEIRRRILDDTVTCTAAGFFRSGIISDPKLRREGGRITAKWIIIYIIKQQDWNRPAAGESPSG